MTMAGGNNQGMYAPARKKYWRADDVQVKRAGRDIILTAPCGEKRYFKPSEVALLIAKLARAVVVQREARDAEISQDQLENRFVLINIMLKKLSSILRSWLGRSQMTPPARHVYTYPCPVCGYITDWDCPVEQISDSFDICSCCGVGFGYDNGTFEQLRVKWIAGGAKWFSRARPRPKGWDYREQLKNIGVEK